MGQGRRSQIAVVLAAAAATAGLACSAAHADPPTSPVSTAPFGQLATPPDVDYNNGDFTRPETSATTRFEFRTSSSLTSLTDREQEILQYNSRLDLGSGWKFGWQIQLPFTEKTTTTFDQPGVQGAAGLSDALVQSALIHSIDEHWAYGFGARLVAPPVTESLGTDRWQIMPVAGVRYSFLEIGPDTYFVPVVRYAISFGGNPTARTIREPQIAPTLNIGLPDRWFVTLYPSNDIRINFGTPISGQTGRLFLPFDAAIGRKFTNNLIVSLEVSVPIVKDYPVYDFKSELKATWQF